MIAAGAVSAKSMVRQAQLRSIVTEVRSYDTAITSFKGLYGQLPGDFTDAYSYWGSNCASAASSCNGNNDGQIDIGNPRQELFMAFLHSSLAGLIPGTYTGFSSATNYATEAGKNIPAGKFPNSEWIVGATQGTWYAANINNAIVTKNVFQLGKHFTDSTNEGSLFTSTEVGTIDTKIDDGMPVRGRVWGMQGYKGGGVYSTACFTASSAVGAAATYTYASTGAECVIWFDVTAAAGRW